MEGVPASIMILIQTCNSLKSQMYPELVTGSSGSTPRMMYILVFSIHANNSELSEAQQRCQTSFLSTSNTACGPMEPSFPATEKSNMERTAFASITDNFVELQLRAILCGLHMSWYFFSRDSLGSVYLDTSYNSMTMDYVIKFAFV